MTVARRILASSMWTLLAALLTTVAYFEIRGCGDGGPPPPPLAIPSFTLQMDKGQLIATQQCPTECGGCEVTGTLELRYYAGSELLVTEPQTHLHNKGLFMEPGAEMQFTVASSPVLAAEAIRLVYVLGTAPDVLVFASNAVLR